MNTDNEPNEPNEVAAVCESLKYAARVAREQNSPAYVSMEAGDYSVHETGPAIVGRQLCTVDQMGEIDWAEA